MRLQVGVAVLTVAALAAGGAFAQGTFSKAQPKGRWSVPETPGAPSYTPPKPKTYGVPETPAPKPFKPYEPYKSNNGTSLFGPDGKPKR